MKIQFLNGGLANQAFQYIFARYYELSHPWDVMYMDDSYFALNTVHNGYELEKVFGIRPHMLSECYTKKDWDFVLEEKRTGKSMPQILRDSGIEVAMISEGETYKPFNPFTGDVHMIPCNQFIPEIYDVSGNIYYHGYWIHQQWFLDYRDVFLEIFRFPEILDERNRAYADQILNCDSVSIHIRRGDYIAMKWAWGVEVYREAVTNFIKGAPGSWHLFVFSDDIPWCKEHAGEMEFGRFRDVTYVEGNVRGENYRDMQLMSICGAMIISNSAFCFLAALLNTRMSYYLNCSVREFS